MAKKIGFLNFYLNGSDREGVKELEERPSFLVEAIEDFGVNGYKVSFAFKSQYGSWVCSLTTESRDNTNHKYILSDFGRSPESALARCYWFHHEVCAGEAWDSHMTSIKEFSDR